MNRILQNLGLACKAGKIVQGEDQTIRALRHGKVHFIFLANDAGFHTNKAVRDKSTFYECPLNTDFSSMELSSAIGQNNRKVIGVTDAGFAKIMKEKG